jgi:hypothetical protein
MPDIIDLSSIQIIQELEVIKTKKLEETELRHTLLEMQEQIELIELELLIKERIVNIKLISKTYDISTLPTVHDINNKVLSLLESWVSTHVLDDLFNSSSTFDDIVYNIILLCYGYSDKGIFYFDNTQEFYGLYTYNVYKHRIDNHKIIKPIDFESEILPNIKYGLSLFMDSILIESMSINIKQHFINIMRN